MVVDISLTSGCSKENRLRFISKLGRYILLVNHASSLLRLIFYFQATSSGHDNYERKEEVRGREAQSGGVVNEGSRKTELSNRRLLFVSCLKATVSVVEILVRSMNSLVIVSLGSPYKKL